MPLLAGLTEAQIAKITDIVELLPFPAGDVIIKKGTCVSKPIALCFLLASPSPFLSLVPFFSYVPGTEGNVFYMIKEGNLRVSEIGDGRTYPDITLGPGEYFGERALITGEPRAANIAAVTNVVLMALDRVSFNSLLGPLKELLNQNMIVRVLNSIRWFDTVSGRGKLQVAKAFQLEVVPAGTTVCKVPP